MILPGVSGGYLLLLLGQYENILGAIDQVKDALLGDAGLNLALLEEAAWVVVPVGIGVAVGVVGVSTDGETWHEWPCDTDDAQGGFPGCAGVAQVWTTSDNGVDPTDPNTAGGDAFDLATLGLSRARFVRIRDSGTNTYEGVSGGFDLDALAIVNGQPITR